MSDTPSGYRVASALSGSDVAIYKLMVWTGCWSMIGSHLLCAQCLASQSADQADKPFMHVLGCTAISTGLYLWQETSEILSHLPLSQSVIH